MSTLRIDPVTRRYVGALFDLAKRKDAMDAVQADVERLAAELAVPAVSAYLFDTRIALDERQAKLGPVVDSMHTLTKNFVGLLFDKRREEVLRGLAAAFHERRLEDEGAAEGVVESPAALGDAEVDALATALSKTLGKRVTLENKVVPELIAGVRVTADNRMIDFSARGRLDGLRRSMLASALPSAAGA